MGGNVPSAVQRSSMFSGVEDPSAVPQSHAGKAVTLTTKAEFMADLEGQPFKMQDGEPVKLRVLVDHSIIEAYAQDGRAVTTRTYCKPSADSVGLEIFNSGPDNVTATVVVHTLDTANV